MWYLVKVKGYMVLSKGLGGSFLYSKQSWLARIILSSLASVRRTINNTSFLYVVNNIPGYSLDSTKGAYGGR